jgi:hypothetical protein
MKIAFEDISSLSSSDFSRKYISCLEDILFEVDSYPGEIRDRYILLLDQPGVCVLIARYLKNQHFVNIIVYTHRKDTKYIKLGDKSQIGGNSEHKVRRFDTKELARSYMIFDADKCFL